MSTKVRTTLVLSLYFLFHLVLGVQSLKFTQTLISLDSVASIVGFADLKNLNTFTLVLANSLDKFSLADVILRSIQPFEFFVFMFDAFLMAGLIENDRVIDLSRLQFVLGMGLQLLMLVLFARTFSSTNPNIALSLLRMIGSLNGLWIIIRIFIPSTLLLQSLKKVQTH